MSPATSAAAVSVPGVFILQSPSTLRPSPAAHLLPSGAARPLQATSASRRLPAAAVRAQSAAEQGQEPLPPDQNYILVPPFGLFVPKSSWALGFLPLIALPWSVVFSGFSPESEFYKIEAILRCVCFMVFVDCDRIWSLYAEMYETCAGRGGCRTCPR